MRNYLLLSLCISSLCTLLGTPIHITPDYTNITHPANIAPLNFDIKGAIDPTVTLEGLKGGTSIVKRGNQIRYSLKQWRAFCAENRGSGYVMIFADQGKTLYTATNSIPHTLIDSHLVYRLIPPSYEGFAQLGIYQRDLTSFIERPVFTNAQTTTKQCMNCHSFCQNDPERFSLHIRADNAGTILYRDAEDQGIKRNFKVGPFFASGVYPAWHPSGNYIAFSVNETMQSFYTTHHDKIEVQDSRSDMMLYDVRNDTVIPVELDPELFDCFPTWSPDGKTLYSVAATVKGITNDSEKIERSKTVIDGYDKVRYNLIMRDFDPIQATFSAPRELINAAKEGYSITLPRVSPDGRWLMITAAPYGVFHIWHKAADLYLIDLQSKTMRPLDEVNSPDVDSYHSFASSGEWFVFSSRRDDGAYTRPYFSHFDPETGKAGKPFILPVRCPSEHTQRMLSYNIPEFTKGPITRSPREIRRTVNLPTQDAKISE